MEEYKHWATTLETGDRVLATIRHATDGTKNLVNVEVIVTGNNIRDSKIRAALSGNIYVIPYNELRQPITNHK